MITYLFVKKFHIKNIAEYFRFLKVVMVKKIFVFGFVFLYFLAMLRPLIPLANYLINQDYIAEFLCINKDLPEMQCNGKCQLAIKIEEQNQEKQKNLPRIQLEDYPIGFGKITQLKLKNILIVSNNSFSYKENYCYQPFSKIFRPPITLV